MIRRSRKHALRGVALAAGMTLALGVTGLAMPAGAATAKRAVGTATVPGMGLILVDAHGHALYTHTDANGQAVACTGACAGIWPAVTVAAGAKVKAPKGVKGLSTTGDTHQVTSDGLPLYSFAKDTHAKEAKGDGLDGFGGTWHVVTVKAIKAKSTPTTNAGTGGVSF